MSMAIRHRDRIGAVVTLGSPLNLRYSNLNDDPFEAFNPATYRWQTRYEPEKIVAAYYHGLVKIPAWRPITPVFGRGDDVMARVAAVNPADLIFTTGLQPGELAIYIHYPGRGEWNFAAQAESFAWLAASRGDRPDPRGRSGRTTQCALLPREHPAGAPLARPTPAAALALMSPRPKPAEGDGMGIACIETLDRDDANGGRDRCRRAAAWRRWGYWSWQ